MICVFSLTQGWKWHSPSCYLVGEDLSTFDEAKRTCEGYGAALVTITNRWTPHTYTRSIVAIKKLAKVFLPTSDLFQSIKGSSRPLPTAWCSAAPAIPSGLALVTKRAPTHSTGSVGMKCHTPTGIETSQVSRTCGSANELGQMQREESACWLGTFPWLPHSGF